MLKTCYDESSLHTRLRWSRNGQIGSTANDEQVHKRGMPGRLQLQCNTISRLRSGRDMHQVTSCLACGNQSAQALHRSLCLRCRIRDIHLSPRTIATTHQCLAHHAQNPKRQSTLSHMLFDSQSIYRYLRHTARTSMPWGRCPCTHCAAGHLWAG